MTRPSTRSSVYLRVRSVAQGKHAQSAAGISKDARLLVEYADHDLSSASLHCYEASRLRWLEYRIRMMLPMPLSRQTQTSGGFRFDASTTPSHRPLMYTLSVPVALPEVASLKSSSSRTTLPWFRGPPAGFYTHPCCYCHRQHRTTGSHCLGRNSFPRCGTP